MDTLVSLAGQFPLLGPVRDLHPLAGIHASQTKKRSDRPAAPYHNFLVSDGEALLVVSGFLQLVDHCHSVVLDRDVAGVCDRVDD